MEFQNQSPQIETSSFFLIFGQLYGRSLELGYSIGLPIILKQMDKLRLSIEVWVIY